MVIVTVVETVGTRVGCMRPIGYHRMVWVMPIDQGHIFAVGDRIVRDYDGKGPFTAEWSVDGWIVREPSGNRLPSAHANPRIGSLTAAANAVTKYVKGEYTSESGNKVWYHEADWVRRGERAPSAAHPGGGQRPVSVPSRGASEVTVKYTGDIIIARMNPEWHIAVPPDYCHACGCRVVTDVIADPNDPDRQIRVCVNGADHGETGRDAGWPWWCTACRKMFYADRWENPTYSCPNGHRDHRAPAINAEPDESDTEESA